MILLDLSGKRALVTAQDLSSAAIPIDGGWTVQ